MQPLRVLTIKGTELPCADLSVSFTARTSIPVICDSMDMYDIAQRVSIWFLAPMCTKGLRAQRGPAVKAAHGCVRRSTVGVYMHTCAVGRAASA